MSKKNLMEGVFYTIIRVVDNEMLGQDRYGNNTIPANTSPSYLYKTFEKAQEVASVLVRENPHYKFVIMRSYSLAATQVTPVKFETI